MSKEEIVEFIKSKTENFRFQAEIDAYTKGFLDALSETYEITWNERSDIEEELENE